jgi:hypothetical protein
MFTDACGGVPRVLRLQDGRSLSFSLSHAPGFSCIAIASSDRGSDAAIGVDIEAEKELRDPLVVAQYAYAQSEIDAITAARPEDRSRLFLRIWTRKESVVKCAKGSVASDMSHFEVPAVEHPGSWTLRPGLNNLKESLRLEDIDIDGRMYVSVCWKPEHGDAVTHTADENFVNDLIEISSRSR